MTIKSRGFQLRHDLNSLNFINLFVYDMATVTIAKSQCSGLCGSLEREDTTVCWIIS